MIRWFSIAFENSWFTSAIHMDECGVLYNSCLLVTNVMGISWGETYLEPKLRHLRWPGINLLALLSRIDPLGRLGSAEMGVAVLAGDKFNEAIADGSMWWMVATAATDGTTDSLELPDEELGGGFGGSRIKDFLQQFIIRIENLMLIQCDHLELTCIDPLRKYSVTLQCTETIECISVRPVWPGYVNSRSFDNWKWHAEYCSSGCVVVRTPGRPNADVPNQCIPNRWETIPNTGCTAASNFPDIHVDFANYYLHDRWPSGDRMYGDPFCWAEPKFCSADRCSPFAWPTTRQIVSANCLARAAFLPPASQKRRKYILNQV